MTHQKGVWTLHTYNHDPPLDPVETNVLTIPVCSLGEDDHGKSDNKN